MDELITNLLDPSQGSLYLLGAIIVGTFISEDLTCLTVSLLVTRGQIGPLIGVLGCLLGIFIGDIGLFLMGRVLGRGVLKLKYIRKRLPAEKLDRLARKADRFGWSAVLASRFLPGTRIPVYVGAGFVGQKAGLFILWLFLAVLAWAPLVVLFGASLGPSLLAPVEAVFGRTWLTLLIAAIVLLVILRLVVKLFTRFGRKKFIAAISRIWRYEFWPIWLFQTPMVAVWVWCALKYRSAMAFTAVNPEVLDGGVVGESKWDMLRRFPKGAVVDTGLIEPGGIEDRLTAFLEFKTAGGYDYPLILKPDASQRGEGFMIVGREDEARDYLRRYNVPTLVQAYHPGPFEAGVFYTRIPGEPGRIFSITDKQFQRVVGDGRSTLRELIWSHPRYRMQADRFFARQAEELDLIIPKGESYQLALAGSHCQGTLFGEGAHLISEPLRLALDELIRAHFPSFHFGRLDIRYSDPDKFMAGEDLGIVEINGVSAESTNIYDPGHNLLFAYKTLARQYELMYRIGRANMDLGAEPTRPLTLLKNVIGFYRTRKVNLVSD